MSALISSLTASSHTGQTLWKWITGALNHFPLALDGLSLTMLGVVTGGVPSPPVRLLVHAREEGYSRFFTYTNLFIASMVVLVLADDLLLVYLGWEGVGLCSYLLIGFSDTDPANGAAALKAFVVTRVGDVFLASVCSFFTRTRYPQHSRNGGTVHRHVCRRLPCWSFAWLMLLGGAVGKSAQPPLQTWLADAMAGPTPVSR
ncbi:proton-conducting transporter membrane subunit [Shigella flexneri]